MADRILPLTRRAVVSGLGAAVLGPAMAPAAQPHLSLRLQAGADLPSLRPGEPDTPVWSLQSPKADAGVLRFTRGDLLDVTLANELPVRALLNWHGLDGVPTAEPLTARPALAPGATENTTIPLRHAGT